MRVPNELIAETWEIVESPERIRLQGFPFMLKRTGEWGHEAGFPCHTIEEAHAKLNDIARMFDEKKYLLAIA